MSSVLVFIISCLLTAFVGAAEVSQPDSRSLRDVEGWTVRVDDRLLADAPDAVLGARALRFLEAKLVEIKAVVPADRLKDLQAVTIVLDLHCGSLTSMQYHPDAGWLRANGFQTDLAKCVHLPRAEDVSTQRNINEQPWVILHELAHAFHDQQLSFDEPRIKSAYEKFKASGHGNAALLYNGQRVKHYGLTNQMEFFAEMTESFFGVNDFFPFNRAELQEAEPEIFQLLTEIWISPPSQNAADGDRDDVQEQTHRDPIRQMQILAEATDRASWGYWGDQPEQYASYSSHSNRLIPVYTFGMTLDAVAGNNSVYRNSQQLKKLYGNEPAGTLNIAANYFDQTDVYRLQQMAAEAGKKYIILVVFDGLDWQTTRAAAIATTGIDAYREGRGTGFAFQDYRGAPTDFGLCVTSPANDGTTIDVNAQAVRTPGGTTPGGYDPLLGGQTAWSIPVDNRYLMGRARSRPHAVTDSAASATSLCSGCKTYNDSINVGVQGEHVEPIARSLQAQGYAVGVVTSVPVSHATPACAYANNVSRDDYQDISRDLLGQRSIAHRDKSLKGLDVLIGCGFGVHRDQESDQGNNFESGNKYVADSTLAAIDVSRGGSYRLAMRTAGRTGKDVLAEAALDAKNNNLRLFGFFGTTEGHLPYRTANGDFDPVAGRSDDPSADVLKKKYAPITPYTKSDIDENPTLADMTTTALDVLGKQQRFWCMVEAGDVDWASHANNIDTAIGAVKSGDDAFRAIVEWIDHRKAWNDSVVIVTSDHGHLFVLTEPSAFAQKP